MSRFKNWKWWLAMPLVLLVFLPGLIARAVCWAAGAALTWVAEDGIDRHTLGPAMKALRQWVWK